MQALGLGVLPTTWFGHVMHHMTFQGRVVVVVRNLFNWFLSCQENLVFQQVRRWIVSDGLAGLVAI